jgi:hypothetical protein
MNTTSVHQLTSDNMESSKSFECETSINDSYADAGADGDHAVEHEQTVQRLSVSIEGLKRVCASCDADTEDSEDEGAVIISAKKGKN